MKPIPFKLFSFFIFCALACFCLSCQGDASQTNTTAEDSKANEPQIEASPIKEDKNISVSYEGPHAVIAIENNLLNHTQIKQMFIKGSASAKPDSTARIPLATDMLLSPKKLELLENAIVTSGFMGLDDAYGAPKDQRSYPSTIKISYKGQTKEVVFRSNPSFGKSPVSFKRVEATLLNLHKQAVISAPGK